MTRWEMMTPEAARPPPATQGRPGLGGTIGARRVSTARKPQGGKRQEAPTSRWSRVRATLDLVPWGALAACSFLLTGLLVYLVHAKQAAYHSQQIFQLLGSTSQGYPHFLDIFSGSYAITSGLAGGCILASSFLAMVRLSQKLLKSDTRKDQWGRPVYLFLLSLSIFALLAIAMPAIWFLLNSWFLSAWGFGVWTLCDAATAAGVNMLRWSSGSAPADPMAVVQAQDLICPSDACFNMSYYTWLESSACLCSQQLVVALQSAARAALSSIVWVLGGTGCLLVGTLIAAAQGAASFAAVTADWHLISMLRRRGAQGSPPHRQEQEKYATPGNALQKNFMYGPGFYTSPYME